MELRCESFYELLFQKTEKVYFVWIKVPLESEYGSCGGQDGKCWVFTTEDSKIVTPPYPSTFARRLSHCKVKVGMQVYEHEE